MLAIGAGRASLRSWQDRGRHPSLTVLLVLELYLVFLAAPMAAKGLAITWPVAETLVLAVVVIIVIMSHRRGAIAAAFSLIWDLSPTTFANLPAAKGGGPDELATMLYFSLTTLTTTGYGDIVPVDRSPAAWRIWGRLSGSSTSPLRSPVS